MSGDYSRDSFDALRDYAGVFLQQGRAALDADWNEMVRVFERRIRAGTVDTIGRAAVPRETITGFQIQLAAGPAIEIGRGRLYLDGMLLECHGAANFPGSGDVDLPDPVFDRAREGTDGSEGVLDELIPPADGDFLPYDRQPYWPTPEPFPENAGPHLVYLVAWQREVTPLENPELLEPALGGIDTTTRWQTVWQVRVLPDVGPDATCATPDDELAGWLDEIAPSNARLTTATIDIEDPEDPCLVPPTDGYTGIENQFYRVELHSVGDSQGDARFKFSRENVSVAAAIESFASPANRVTVRRIGRDENLRFRAGDWVEIADDRRELDHRSGQMLRIAVVHEETREIELEGTVEAELVPSGINDDTVDARRSRMIRWDQRGVIRLADGTEWVDLDAGTSDGLIPVPPDDSAIVLESGITVSFTTAVGPGGFREMDHWRFAARTAGTQIEELRAAPPDGVQRHYCRLAIVTFPETVLDCRVFWPPEFEGECCCTVVVQPGEDIQAAIDLLPPEGGCVCLKAGLHVVSVTVVIARSGVSLHGESQGAVLRLPGDDPVLAIRGSSFAQPAERVRVHGIRFEGGEISAFGGIVTVEDALDLRIEDCDLRSVGQEQESAFVGLRIVASRQVAVTGCSIAGVQTGLWATMRSDAVSVTECRIDLGARGERGDGIVGIFVDDANGPFLVADCEIAGGLFGVVIDDDPLGAPSSLARASVIRANRVFCVQPEGADPGASSALVGIDVAAEDCLIEGNEVRYPGPGNIGIRVSASGARVLNNRCIATSPVAPAFGLMIGVDPERADRLIANVEARGNTISGAQGGILVVQASDVAVVANDLQITSAQAAGVLAQDSRAVEVIDNRIRGAATAIAAASTGNLRVEGNTATGGTLGILVLVGERPNIVRNRVEGASDWGIVLMQIIARAEVAANRVIGCGFGFPPGGIASGPPGIGIGAVEVLGELNLESNEVMNTGNGPDDQRSSTAIGLFGDLILEARVAGNLVTYFIFDEIRNAGNEDRALLMRGYVDQTFIFGNASITLGFPIQILDNKFIGTGFTALVELLQTQINDNTFIRFERVIFNDNYCSHFSPPELDDSRATVSLVGARGIVMGNHIKATTPDYFSVNFNSMPSTYVGNVVEGPPIQGTPIPTPDSDYNLST